ncbi:MacB family efflux pump subunit [Pseudomonas mendocina]|nr:MacB family efflux pump subunit [Pseudomonas mendocina]MBH3339909.1 MacB family efflux pump subunit [Pseudomonas mendocina]
MSTPLISLQQVRKHYGGGQSPRIDVLHGISLDIHAGEFVAIVGASGSGKSTLMNILGCLDRPSSGHYRFAGRDVGELDDDSLARLRREAFGFVFQGYHLIPSASALENVEMPAIYAGTPAAQRHARASELLERLGLASRCGNRPNQLSGGQQQRVSIARALMNGGQIILADEPTGALDSQSGAQVMALLDELAEQGHTVILITHDREVAARAQRMIEVRDGLIVSDSGTCASSGIDSAAALLDRQDVSAWAVELAESLRAAWRVMALNPFRTALTLLGIVIGVTSVIVMLAIGEGSKRQVIEQMSAFGSNLIYLGRHAPTPRAPRGVLTLDDVAAIATLPQVDRIMPVNGEDALVRRGALDIEAYIHGNGLDFSAIYNWPTVQGRYFDAGELARAAAVAVLGQHVREQLFPRGENPIGQFILIANTPFEVIGVLAGKGASSGDADNDKQIIVPYSTASVRLFGKQDPEFVTIAAADASRVKETEQAIVNLMLNLHRGVRDYKLYNNAALIQAEARTQNSLSLMLGAIAAISLLVGGIGVMNIMLMSVRERTREIGIRMATGARQGDILRQFLSESALLAVLGGLTGIALAWALGTGLRLAGMHLVFSPLATLAAFTCALLTGILFGFMPARQAARLDPVKALSSE